MRSWSCAAAAAAGGRGGAGGGAATPAAGDGPWVMPAAGEVAATPGRGGPGWCGGPPGVPGPAGPPFFPTSNGIGTGSFDGEISWIAPASIECTVYPAI